MMSDEELRKARRRRGRLVPGTVAVWTGALLLPACGSSTRHRSTPSTTTSSAGSVSALEHAFVSVVNRVRPEVVEISTNVGLGSGVVYDSKGDIVTNDHVVGTATTFKVQMSNGTLLNASLVGAFPADDLAVVRVEKAKSLTPASFGNSSSLQVGDIVFAIGSPLGLASSATNGIVSYNGRVVSEPNGVELPSTIQTSAPINPGNSGGALVDLSGDVVGIPTLAAVDQEIGGVAAGIGFAIPSDTVKLIAPQLIATGHVEKSGRAALGIVASDAFGPSGIPVGVIVLSVTPNGAAAKAGIAAGDLITAINGQTVSSLSGLQAILAQLSPGASARVTVLSQGGATRVVTVVLGQLTS